MRQSPNLYTTGTVVIPWLSVRRIKKKKKERVSNGGGFLEPVVFCGCTQFSYCRQKKPRCTAKRLRPEPKAKGGDALGRMKQETNKNKCTERRRFWNCDEGGLFRDA